MFLRKEFLLPFFICIAYVAFFFLFQLFANRAGYFPLIPTDEKLRGFWDSVWYLSIVENGYENKAGLNNNGFFILLPAIWKLSHLGGLGMSLLNAFFFSVGFGIMGLIIRPSVKDSLMWLTIPPIFFMFVPYTEALFFLLVSLIFYGVIRSNSWLIAAGLFFMALLRPSVIFVVPAAFVMLLFTEQKTVYGKVIKDYILFYLLPAASGLGLFCWYQYSRTGVWFTYFHQQSEYRGHWFSIPALPFNTMDGNRTLWINALAFFTAFISLIVMVSIFVKWLTGRMAENKLLVFSLTYMSVTLIYTVFFTPKWADGLSMVSAICRYVMATPFFIVIMHHFTREREYSVIDFVIIIVLANIVWLSFGSYHHIQKLLFYNFNTLLIVFYMLSANKKHSWATVVVIALNFFAQAMIFQQGLNGLYPE